ncbi:two-component system sensor histidine kinase NtrB [Nitrospira moscoviensis]|uniref:histidine kinase n=1 Tax=Nitrospira moscoviensis TaxID=42253 RepID=A0A0K2GBK3_NITMO|nr:ATP-binding protein [Nitrospira moscoviensis]ALA58330.1 putative Sensor histidine kinase FleS [Nitrospira moscoviensis]
MTTATWDAGERALLQAAFESFDEAAHTLQQSYSTLTARVEQMDLELAQSNEALRRQLHVNEAMRRHLDGILESLSTGVLVLDGAGVVTRANGAAAAFLGAGHAGDLQGRPAEDVLRAAGLTSSDRPQRIGSRVVTITGAPLTAEAGGASGSLVLLHDVTRVCLLEEQLRRRERLAAMGEMIGRIAHEIRNPLGSVELFASMVRRDSADRPSVQRYAEQISQSVHAMDRLLANLLLYTRPDRAPRAWHHAEQLILDSLTLAAHAIAKAPVDIRLDLDPRIPLIWCHEGQMKQVCLNLIVNAVQAMPAGGRLTVSLTNEAESALGVPAVRLTVADTGDGIDPSHRSRIFDPFFTTKDEGTGLGLAIVHAIVEAHQGHIDVDSAPGRGTTFTLVLPHPAPLRALPPAAVQTCVCVEESAQ